MCFLYPSGIFVLCVKNLRKIYVLSAIFCQCTFTTVIDCPVKETVYIVDRFVKIKILVKECVVIVITLLLPYFKQKNDCFLCLSRGSLPYQKATSLSLC